MDIYPDRFTFWRNILISGFSGAFFSAGWWIYIDSDQIYHNYISANKECILPGLGSTFALIVLMVLPYPIKTGLYFEHCKCTPKLLWILLFFTLVIMFSSFIWSIYVWIMLFILPKDAPLWPGIAVFSQNLFIMTSGLVFKFAIKYPD